MNFCERLQGEDLLEFHQQVVLGFTSEEEVWSTMVPTDLPIDLNASTQNLTQVGGGGQGGPMTGIDSSGLMATPIDEPISYTNPCKCTNALFSFFLSFFCSNENFHNWKRKLFKSHFFSGLYQSLEWQNPGI